MDNETNITNRIPDAPNTNGQSRTGSDSDSPPQESIEQTKPDTKESAKEELMQDAVSTTEKVYADALRKLLNVPEDEELGDLEERIGRFEEKAAAALSAARNQVIDAELKALQGYDTKLLDRLLDRSKLTIGDDGRVSGLEKELKQIEAEFPAVKLKKDHKLFLPENPADGHFESVSMNELIRGKR